MNCKVFMILKTLYYLKSYLWTFPHEDCIPKVNSTLQDLIEVTALHFQGLFVWHEMHPTEKITAFGYFGPVVEDREGNDWVSKTFKEDFTLRLHRAGSWPAGKDDGERFPPLIHLKAVFAWDVCNVHGF